MRSIKIFITQYFKNDFKHMIIKLHKLKLQVLNNHELHLHISIHKY